MLYVYVSIWNENLCETIALLLNKLFVYLYLLGKEHAGVQLPCCYLGQYQRDIFRNHILNLSN